MPRGPKGEKRPADVIGAAVQVMRIATGDAQEQARDMTAAKRGRLGGLKGGKKRAARLSKRKRTSIAKKAAQTRWR